MYISFTELQRIFRWCTRMYLPPEYLDKKRKVTAVTYAAKSAEIAFASIRSARMVRMRKSGTMKSGWI